MKKYLKLISFGVIGCLFMYLWFQSWTPQARGFFYSFNDDLYTPIGTGKINLSKKGEKILVPLTPKYESGYTLYAITPQKIYDDAHKYHLDGMLKATILCTNMREYSFCSRSGYTYPVNPASEKFGFDLLYLFLNRNQVQCKNLEIEIEVIKPYTQFGVNEPVPFTIYSNFSL